METCKRDPYKSIETCKRNLYQFMETYKKDLQSEQTPMSINPDKETYIKTDLHQKRPISKETYIKRDLYQKRPTSKETYIKRDLHQKRPISKETYINIVLHQKRCIGYLIYANQETTCKRDFWLSTPICHKEGVASRMSHATCIYIQIYILVAWYTYS